MDREGIRSGLASGRLHPLPLLMHFRKEGNEGLARFVAEVGEGYVGGRERLRFLSLVREAFPDIREAEEAERLRARHEHREKTGADLGAALREKLGEKKALRKGPMPSGGGWQLPLDRG